MTLIAILTAVATTLGKSVAAWGQSEKWKELKNT